MTTHAATASSREPEVAVALVGTAVHRPETTAAIPPAAPDWGLALGISTADFAARSFTSDQESLKNIRRFVRETIGAWRLDSLADDMTTVVGELTANAVLHALTAGHTTHNAAWLGMVRTSAAVICAVADPSSAPPARRSPRSLAEGGRGLFILDALTSKWGYVATSPRGKTVWARVPAPSR